MSLKEWAMDEFLTYLMRWAEERKDSIHLCCKKLKIFGMPVENTMKVLSMVQLDCIQDVEVNQNWHLSSLATFAPLLGQTSNVQRLILSASEEQEQHVVVQFASQFLSCTTSGISIWNLPSSCQAAWTRCSGERGTTGRETVKTTLQCQVHCLILRSTLKWGNT